MINVYENREEPIKMSFISNDFMLKNETAKVLYESSYESDRVYLYR